MEKRLAWCREQIEAHEGFENVIFSDECSVAVDNHSRLCFRKKGNPRKLKPKPKHPHKVHVWGGISKRGATQIVIFTGILTATRFCDVIDSGLLPFVETTFSNGYRFQQDNDPKHTSRFVQQHFNAKRIIWWKTPPESPDLNPIENVWAAMKKFLRDVHKPRDEASLIEGIRTYWRTLSPETCNKYIEHLHTVIPRVIELNGGPSGY